MQNQKSEALLRKVPQAPARRRKKRDGVLVIRQLTEYRMIGTRDHGCLPRLHQMGMSGLMPHLGISRSAGE